MTFHCMRCGKHGVPAETPYARAYTCMNTDPADRGIVLDVGAAGITPQDRTYVTLEPEAAAIVGRQLLDCAAFALGRDVVGPETRRIEGDLVDALEVELEDYQGASASWAAVKAALDGLRARDAEIERLTAALAEARAAS